MSPSPAPPGWNPYPEPAFTPPPRKPTSRNTWIGLGVGTAATVAVVFGLTLTKPAATATTTTAGSDVSSADPALPAVATAAPTPVPVHWCLTEQGALLKNIVVVDESRSTSSCGDAHLLGDLASIGSGFDNGTSLSSMPSTYTQVCRWDPYPIVMGRPDMSDGGSAWASSIWGAAGRKSAQDLCNLEKPAPAPTPAPPCLPRADAVVGKGC